MYYSRKIDSLKDIFQASQVEVRQDSLIVDGRTYPIINDVIILLDEANYPPAVKNKITSSSAVSAKNAKDFAPDIQYTFGEEWKSFPDILPEHKEEFDNYFDIVDIASLSGKRVCDLGCGIGRWSHFLRDSCGELVLVDFSEAVFVARENLRDASNALFFMADIKKLPFRNNFCDFLFCLGVLHHLPSDAIEETRSLKRLAPYLLIYLYYALDNRPVYFKALLAAATIARTAAAKVKSGSFRSAFTWAVTLCVYFPFIIAGHVLNIIGIGKHVPLYDGYRGKSFGRIKQDVYDRFFTRIEQRVSQKQIMSLQKDFTEVRISDSLPYWHFTLKA